MRANANGARFRECEAGASQQIQNMSTFSINVHSEDPFVGKVDERGLRRAAELALVATQASAPAGLSVVITDEETVRDLNFRHLGKDAPTDVLSFPSEDYIGDRDEPPYLGDVLIAFPVAQQQAREAGHPIQDEIHLLTVHGVLHLLGYDHTTADERDEMWAVQNVVLAALREATR